MEGGQFKSSYRPQYGIGQVAEEVPVHFLDSCGGALEQGTKAPYAPRALSQQPTAPTLQCVCVYLQYIHAASDGSNAENNFPSGIGKYKKK